jgi:hypothetical protein
MTTYPLETALYDLAALLEAHPGTAHIQKDLLSIADVVGALEYRLDSLDR